MAPADHRQLHHRVPCNQCPWRKASAPGWLGGFTAESYADVVQENQVPSCHLRDHGPDDPDTAYCVGGLQTAANACIQPYEPREMEAKATVGRNPDCFAHPRDFFSHHSEGAQYVPRVMRPGMR